MKKVLGILFAVSFGLIIVDASFAETVAGENISAPAAAVEKAGEDQKKAEKKNLEAIECTGTIEVTPADPAKKQKYPVVTLKDGDKTFKLIPGEIKKDFSKLEQLAGKVVTVAGKLLPANDKHPLPAIKVDTFSEVQPPTKDELKK